jgi:translation initiation factor 4E binding protein 1
LIHEMSVATKEGSVKSIPKRILINDPSQLPSDYGTTPGGTLFSTTPGGTRIYYDRSFLLQCRNSPLTKTPPSNLAKIPGVTSPATEEVEKNGNVATPEKKHEHKDEPQFAMDI